MPLINFVTQRLPLWRLTWFRRRVFENFGSHRYSRPSFENIQDYLYRTLGSDGVYIEAGALDGFYESNTYFLEVFGGWTGILVEPIPKMYERIKYNRPNAKAFNCALVPKGFPDTSVNMISDHAMSTVHNEAELSPSKRPKDVITVPARTLDSILYEASVEHVDLLSLDVEGFELEVLKGIDFARLAPKYILLECLTEESKNQAVEFLQPYYELFNQVTYRDYLFKHRQ